MKKKKEKEKEKKKEKKEKRTLSSVEKTDYFFKNSHLF